MKLSKAIFFFEIEEKKFTVQWDAVVIGKKMTGYRITISFLVADKYEPVAYASAAPTEKPSSTNSAKFLKN